MTDIKNSVDEEISIKNNFTDDVNIKDRTDE